MTLPQAQVKEAERESTDAARGGSRGGAPRRLAAAPLGSSS